MVGEITEKKLKNKRFCKTEEAIVKAILSAKDKLNLAQLIHLAHASRSTVYRHHGSINEIVPNYEKYLLRKCKTTLNHLIRIKNIRLEYLYERLMIFLLNNQQIIRLILKYGDSSFIEKLVIILKPKIIKTSKISNDEALILYNKEIAGLIELWVHAGFDESNIVPTVEKIMYLTNHAQTRLNPLAEFNRPKT